MYRKRKRKSAHRFSYTPLLRLLMFKPAVHLSILGVILLGVGCFLFLNRIWRITPPDVKPAFKISGLNWAQCWSLKHAARRELARGRFNNAVFAWHSAVQHNPSDNDALQGLVSTLVQGEPSQHQVLQAANMIQWKMLATHTNVDSLTLAADLGERFGMHSWLIEFLAQTEDRLTPRLRASYIKCLLHTRQVRHFAPRWENLDEQFKSTTEMQLYHSAYLLGWGPNSAKTEARSSLLEARQNPQTSRLALRLLLLASAQLGDVELYERAFVQLVEQRQEALQDHVVFWRLLGSIGRRAEAIDRAQSFAKDPGSAQEVLVLTEGYLNLGLRPRAKQVLQHYSTIFPQAEGIWIAYSNLLIDSTSWDELLALALQIRQSISIRDSLYGYSHFLEGRAYLGRNKREPAEIAFRKAADFDFRNRTLGLASARGLIQLGFAHLSLPMLESWREDLSLNSEYWLLLCMAAYELKQGDLLLSAAESAYRLNPDDWNCMNNYAAALLIHRVRAEETIRLTVQLIAKSPNSLIAKVNHSLALVRNGRAEEALNLLNTVNEQRLTEVEACSFNLARFEALINLQRWAEASQADARINSRYLFPSQVDWWMQERQKAPLHRPDKPAA